MPGKSEVISATTLSRNTVVQRIEDLSVDLKRQLREKISALDFNSIACDESTNSTDTGQFRCDANFCCTEDLLDMMSRKGTATGTNIFEALSGPVKRWHLNGTNSVQ